MADVVIDDADAGSPAARWALTRYFDELDRRFPDGFDPGDALADAATRYAPPVGAFVLATADGEPVGCGGVEHLDAETSEIKRMWVSPQVRGAGVGRRLLAELELRVAAAGRSVVVLDTNSTLVEAVALYESSGYEPTDRYNDNRDADRWFTKRLQPS